ncbi:MAG: exopolysaccharide biosynthesis polyprenyl glycosylphosphotransferase [Candidatus Omnitrophica bacterium]|nr:exopolysaccharide biosynthesis polyprenyl glycosylphosphotransferase [Candidatus Omnitrophota bacterium]
MKPRLLVIGAGDYSAKAVLNLTTAYPDKYEVVGLVKCANETKAVMHDKIPVLGSIEDIDKIARQHHVDRIMVASTKLSYAEISKIFFAFRKQRYIVFSMPPDIEQSVASHFGFPFDFSVDYDGAIRWYPPIKRFFDILFSLLLLIITLPLILAAAMAIKITSPGPILYRDKRVGLKGRVYVMYKLRTMYKKSAGSNFEIAGWTRRNSARITPVGRILRLFRIDELPQLVNVLMNDMSLIGPRPETRYYMNILIKEVPQFVERLNVKPGITGWAQVNLGYVASVEDSKKKLSYDIYYIRHLSPSLDMLIALKTVGTVLLQKGAR